MRNLKDESESTRIKQWLAESANRFVAVFRPRLQQIEESL
jgi:hypothetical protein